ncbi:MAG: FKBP-type peptidyl-prolyl cis-trans isomerase [Gammaproteobacteria bacterium]|nr:FKBP-type peptidyl-prolyl cis-trans isomerase [Gammaproteobacteria bacterium]
MGIRTLVMVSFVFALVSGCTQEAEQSNDPMVMEESGLQIKKLKNGYGKPAEAGDYVTVHYTGWLFDETAPDKRGQKFDSSVDRGEKFQFPLGAGRVIRGWDEGVAGMLIGETRELTIPAELAYGDRNIGAIPAGSTLVFEVELFAADAPEGAE